jgi:hypothetical protein
MQGIYTYISETNHVPREYIVLAILSLLFMVPISPVSALALLYFYVCTFRNMCAVPNMAVFCSSITSWFPVMLLMYFLNDFEMVPVAPITGIILVFYIPLSTLLLLLLLLLCMKCRVVEYFISEKRNKASWLTGIREEPFSNLGRDVDSVTVLSLFPPSTLRRQSKWWLPP